MEGANAAAPSATPLLRLGVYGRFMHLYAEVSAEHIRYETPPPDDETQPIDSTRLIVLTRDEFDRERAWSISATAPGPIIVRPCEVGAPWTRLARRLRYISGVWRQTASGYAIELRGPLNLFGTQLSVHALDQDGAVQSQSAARLGAYRI